MLVRYSWIALRLLLALSVLTGGIYPALVTLAARAAFPSESRGQRVELEGRLVGLENVGQPFEAPGLFWGRPSACARPYDASASAGSNLGPLSAQLSELVAARVARLRASDPGNDRPIPIDLVTSSASGLDPHISPAAALWQAPRVARARGLSAQAVEQLVRKHIEGRTFGLLGEPRVNVLELNMALEPLR